MKNVWRTGKKLSRNWSRKRLVSVTEVSRLWFFPSFFFSSIILGDFWAIKVLNPSNSAPSRHFIRKWGRWLPPSSPRQAGLLPPEAIPFPEYSRWAQMLGIPPSLINAPPFLCYLADFFPKHRETLGITRQWVSSISKWSIKVYMPSNKYPWTKLGYDSCPYLLILYWRLKGSKDKTLISFELNLHPTDR